MPKLIFRSNYFKNEPAVHRSNYIKYLGTREGVEMNPDTMPRFFFEDKDMHGKKENYIDYISGRPGVELNEGEQHGLFSYPGARINLEQVMDEVANHKGAVWINVVSMKREDAHRLGFENIQAWQNLVWRHINDISKNFSIEPDNLRWYAAFHNESHHPHIHLVVYSEDEHEGFLRKGGLKDLKSKFTNDIFGEELSMVYSAKTEQRNLVKEQARQSLLLSLGRLNGSTSESEKLDLMVRQLGEKLKNIKGKKVYGYLHKNIKDEVDRIVDELENIPEIRECYKKWMEYQNAINGYYNDNPKPYVPLSKNKEFKSIKNIIIQEALDCECGHSELKSGHSRTESEHSSWSNEQARMLNGSEDSIASTAGRLARKMESLFNNLIGDAKSNSQAVSESKEKSKEKEKKVALGQKDDDSESNENKKYMSM